MLIGTSTLLDKRGLGSVFLALDYPYSLPAGWLSWPCFQLSHQLLRDKACTWLSLKTDPNGKRMDKTAQNWARNCSQLFNKLAVITHFPSADNRKK